jgi:hypothetical protein
MTLGGREATQVASSVGLNSYMRGFVIHSASICGVFGLLSAVAAGTTWGMGRSPNAVAPLREVNRHRERSVIRLEPPVRTTPGMRDGDNNYEEQDQVDDSDDDCCDR